MKATWNEFEVSAVYKGDKASGWKTDQMPENYNRHIVTVKNTLTGKLTRFDYWTSQAQPDMRDAKDALLAFMAFVDDALAAEQHEDIDKFSREFGYEKVSEAYRAWHGCVRALDKLRRIAGQRNLYDLANTLREVDS